MTDPIFDEEPQSPLMRILPPLVLICAFGGFISLAIYAYQAGTQSVGEGELMVVEADAAPMKEKPADPGGMQFPNQDKTIFETFSAGNNQPPKVERVLPAPEEPLAKDAPSVDSPTAWVNGQDVAATAAAPSAPAGVEQVFGNEDAAPAVQAPAPESPPAAMVKNVQEELGKQAVAEVAATAESVNAVVAPVGAPVEAVAKPVELQTKTETKPAEKPVVKAVEEAVVQEKSVDVPVAEVAEKAVVVASEKPMTKPVEKPKAVEKAAAKPEKPAAKTAKGLVQLGAYKSEAEAKADFAKLQKKHSALAGKSPTINRADLGDKGIFYRLRVATDDAKKLCAALSSRGQACMAVK